MWFFNILRFYENMDVTNPRTMQRLLEIRYGSEPETPQGDVLRSPDLFKARVEDTHTGILLPVVKLGNQTNLHGQAGYDRLHTLEYLIHFRLSDSARDRLCSLCWLNLKEKFLNNDEAFVPFINKAFENCSSDNVDDAWEAFKSLARSPIQDDNSFLIKERTKLKNPCPPCIRTAEGVEFTGRMMVPSGSVCRIDCRVVSWSFKGMYGVSLKLGIGGIYVYRSATLPSAKKRFYPKDYYLCIRPDSSFEIRDASGHMLTVLVQNTSCGDKHILIDNDCYSDIEALELKVGCALSSINDTEDGKMIIVQDPKTLYKKETSWITLRPSIKMNKSMRYVEWVCCGMSN